jgi:hypothetical protein
MKAFFIIFDVDVVIAGSGSPLAYYAWGISRKFLSNAIRMGPFLMTAIAAYEYETG